VPAGKSLFLTSIMVGFAYASNSTHYARIFLIGNQDPVIGGQTDGIFYGYNEFICANSSVLKELELPGKIKEKTDINVSVLADFTGIADCTLRGWVEVN